MPKNRWNFEPETVLDGTKPSPGHPWDLNGHPAVGQNLELQTLDGRPGW